MSFILDALKKSESERQRQSGPALFEVKVAPPKGRSLPWAGLLGVLLAVNLAVVGWLLLRSASRSAGAAASPVTAAMPAAPSTSPTPALPGPPLTGAAPGSSSATASAAVAPPTPATAAAANEPQATNTAPRGDADASAEDLAPAVEPRKATGTIDSAVVRATTSGLPSYQDAAAAPGANLPALRLDLHVYAAQPDQRFVFLNMAKLHEGDSLPQGVRVETITPDGVILSYQGTRFVLLRE
ncbi:MAG TPA: general secretion pathway protein GspB [Steroidobacteraceae bacterium]|nr:general secretion pathway protein GspB [Steroidobacteraceae bacterium]